MSLVELREVKKYYHNGESIIRAADGVSLRIERGEFSVLAGPSGSGKTTILNLIGGLDRPDSGEVFVDGDNLTKKDQKALSRIRRHKIGFIFQAYNLVPVLTAEENAEFVLMLNGVPAKERSQRVLALLKEMGMSGLEYRKPGEMSGGQQQRVAVARAMVTEPVIILADEPTANLDSESSINLLNLMRRFNETKGITFLFSSHDERVIHLAKRIIHLRDGKIESDQREGL
ncbi:MAG: ABC transporter ATP-binding protein [bacterium]